MLSSPNKDTWHSVIETYIDSVKDDSKSLPSKEAVLSMLLSLHLLNSKSPADKSSQKEFDNQYTKIKKTATSETNLSKLYSFYQTFVQNDWIDPIDDILTSIKEESCFYKIWIWSSALRLDYVTPATHIPKLTHSRSKGCAIIDNILESKDEFLTTTSLENKRYDGAYPDGKLSKIAKFLLLTTDDGEPLGLLLKRKDNSPLQAFFKDDELDRITRLFFEKLNPLPKADALLKQIYFPIDKGNYHLLVILKSSVLIQTIFDNYSIIKNEKTKQQYNHKKYNEEDYITLPNTLLLSVVNSQPQNVSVNCGSFSGNIRLFCSKPPTWQSQTKPPIYEKNLFNHRQLAYISQKNILGFRQFLVRFDRAKLSIKNPARLKGVVKWLKAIIDDFFAYHYGLLLLPKGWTDNEDTQLKLSHQIFVDPYRDDELFLKAKKLNDWQGELIADFGDWLTHRLAGDDKKLTLSTEQIRLFKEVFKNALYPYLDTLQSDEQTLGTL